MKCLSILAGLLAVLVSSEAYALCLDGTIGGCELQNGCPGEQLCNNGVWDVCEPVAGAVSCTVCGGVGSAQCDANGQIISSCTRAEVCNFCDDDGDGSMDEGLQNCTPPVSCGSNVELCDDSIDNDCDGSIDEGCPIPPLTLAHDGADGWFQSIAASNWAGDLTKSYWPKLNPPALAIGGSVTHFRLDSDHEALFCSGLYFTGDCQLVSAPNSGFNVTGQTVYSYELFETEFFRMWGSFNSDVWPNDSEPADDCWGCYNMAEHLQGLAHDSSNWYISKVDAIYQVPLTADLADQERLIWTRKVGIPEQAGDHDHIGDIDQFEGLLFAPFEGGNSLPRVGIYNASDLSLVKVLEFPPFVQARAGWVAINPVNGLLYSSSDPHDINVFEWRDRELSLGYLYTIKLPDTLPSIGDGNGVAFSDSGHLYAPVPKDDHLRLIVFEIVGRDVTVLHDDVVFPDAFASGNALEGVDVLPVSTLGSKPKNLNGDIHVLSYNWDAGSDNWSIFHVAVDDPTAL